MHLIVALTSNYSYGQAVIIMQGLIGVINTRIDSEFLIGFLGFYLEVCQPNLGWCI